VYKIEFINVYNKEVFKVFNEKKVENIKKIFKRIENNKGHEYFELDEKRNIDCEFVTYTVDVYNKLTEYKVYFSLKDIVYKQSQN
jgi:hypothetical protein